MAISLSACARNWFLTSLPPTLDLALCKRTFHSLGAPLDL